ncbi:DUF6879 family protein, partial [Pilimelia terevasa]|uniref:DUF6879 family protein n=1 Tax=Pilimelia terevasa TaxID=53372 RepID=UPI003571523E
AAGDPHDVVTELSGVGLGHGGILPARLNGKPAQVSPVGAADPRSVLEVAFPGTDYYLLDDRTVMFLHFDGDLNPAGYSATDDASTVELCRSAFERCWSSAVANDAFKPG